MTPTELVRARLEGKNCAIGRDRGHAFEAQCPAHEDRTPSLSVATGQDGRALLTCHAGCRLDDVLDALALAKADLFPEGTAPRDSTWTEEAEYVYQDADGRDVFKVVRFTGKRFRQQRKTAAGWEWGMEGVKRQLFRLPEVLAAKERGDFVFVTEGEKDALAVRAAGYTATTMPGGAGKWEPHYTAALAKAKVVILADDDEPGRAHALAVWREVYKVAARAVVRLPAEGCKDAADHIAAGHPLDKTALRPLKELQDLPASSGSGARTLTARAFAARPGSQQSLEVIGPLFQRGMRTVIGAQTGEGKTSFGLHAIAALIGGEPFLDEPRWRGHGTRALIVDLEQGEETVKARLGEVGLDTAECVDVLWEPSGIALDKREEDRAMVRDVMREGHYDLVLLDPLYQMHLGSGNDEEVAAATMRIVDGWAREFNCSVVIPMHARKPPVEAAGRNMTIHDIAGVGTWLRNAEFVLGLQLMFSGQSRLWFFKDRIGRGPEIRSHWWLDFKRGGGFKRNHKEVVDKRKRAMKTLLKRDEGASREELMAVEGATLPNVEEILRRAHRQGDRWRTRQWTAADAVALGQESFDT